jgi:hypothetical protein
MSHKMRVDNLGKTEVDLPLCGYCGTPVARSGGKFCDSDCYTAKRRSQPAEQRFWSKVDRSGDCWLWTASANGAGYGQFVYRGRLLGAHVVAYELTNGPVPSGLEILHRCDNPLCVRPDHLAVGTHLENVQDASAKGRLRVSRPTRQRLSVADIEEIRSLVASGERRFRVANNFGISKTYVTQIMSGRARRYDAPLAGCGE